MNQLQALFRLQSLETSLDESKARLEQIEADLTHNETLQQATAEFEARKSEYQSTQGKLTDMELEHEGLVKKIYEVDELLYSGKITSPKELQERQSEIESLKRRREKLESDLEIIRQNLKETQQAYEQASAAFKQAEEVSATQNQHLMEERQNLRAQMALWINDRKRLLKEVDPTNHKIYKRIKSEKGGVAVTRLEGDACAFCRVEQNQTTIHRIRHEQKILQCSSCGRILADNL